MRAVSKGFCDTHLTAHVTIREGFLTHFSTHFTIQDHADSLSLMRAVEFDQAFTFAYSGSKLCSKVCVTTLYCVTFVKCVTLRFTVWLLHMVREWWCRALAHARTS